MWLAWGLGTFEDLDRRLPGEDGRNSDGAKGHTITHAAYLQIEKKTSEYVILSSAIIFNVVCLNYDCFVSSCSRGAFVFKTHLVVKFLFFLCRGKR